MAAATLFARCGKGDAMIGSLDDLAGLLAGETATLVSTSREGATYQ